MSQGRPLSPSLSAAFTKAVDPAHPHELQFGYSDAKGKASERRALPFEVKDGILFAFCLDRRELRKFVIERMDSIKVGPAFIPAEGHVVVKFSPPDPQ